MNVKQISRLTLKNVIAPESRPTQSDCCFCTQRRLGITRETLYAASSAYIAQFFPPPRNQCFLITKVERVKAASQNLADFLSFFSGVVRWNVWSWKSAVLWRDEWNWNENPTKFVSTAASCVLRLRQWVSHVLILPTDRTCRCFVFLHFKVRKRINI